MNKIMKNFLIASIISLIIVALFATRCFAVVPGIDMNLTGDTATNNTDTASNSTTNSTSSALNNTANTNAQTTTGTSSSSSGTVSSISSLPESELGFTNILNILLITVGVILILLAIAILIKIKK